MSLQEVIHHIDLDRKNNALDNLVLFKDNSSHRECHQVSLERCTLSFLNNGVWFDFRSNEYTLRYESDACERSIKPINLSGYEKKEWKEPCYRYADDSGRYVVRRCHVVIAEKTLGRSLYSNEIVHHLDGNYLNNVPDNLVILTKAQHYRTHYSLQICGAELLKSGLLGFSRERLEYFVKIVD